jgi:hypothetical protein
VRLGHDVRLMPAKDVKAYVKRNKNDAVDAEAICEAVRRPTMRFVRIKSAEQQGQLMQHRTRDLLLRQRTQTINALRAHLAELGITAAQGREGPKELLAIVADMRTDGKAAGIAALARSASTAGLDDRHMATRQGFVATTCTGIGASLRFGNGILRSMSFLRLEGSIKLSAPPTNPSTLRNVTGNTSCRHSPRQTSSSLLTRSASGSASG